MNVLHDKMSGWAAGVYDCYTNAEYHAHSGISKSSLDLIHKSPAHYLASKSMPREETPAMKLGTAFHTATLEPDSWGKCFTTVDGDRRRKATQEAIKAAEAEGKTVLTDEEYTTVGAMAVSVWHNRIAAALIRGAAVEHSIFSEIDGVHVKCRPDGWQVGKNVMFDLKSTEDASPAGFARAVARYRYHVQDAYYRHVVASLTGEDADKMTFIFIAVEKKPPYAVALYSLDELAKLQGWVEAREDLRVYREAEERDEWKGYSPKIETLSLPRWATAE